jgi:predicted hydrocarbon binding protein
MSPHSQPSYHYPNKMGRIILLALEEILGRTGIHAVLNQMKMSYLINNYPPSNLDREFSFETLSNIQQGLESIYGPRAGQGLALRSGQACFKYGLREFGPMLGITDMAFRLLPLPTKISNGARIFADTFNKFTDQQVRIEENETQIHWHIERCPICWERTTNRPGCGLAVGLLQEALYWTSGGKYFVLKETACIAQGDETCTILIEKEPVN